jgi:hypothetical protein
MAQSGTATFINPEEYGAAIGAARVSVVVTGGGDFNARLTWLNLDHLYLLHSRENLPRIGDIRDEVVRRTQVLEAPARPLSRPDCRCRPLGGH